MASLRPGSPPTSRARRTPAATSSGVLPPDVWFEVLVRLPAKDLCRFRAVCRSWRALTSDRLFITAHAARHPGPLFLAKFRDEKTVVCVVDLSGNVVKRITGTVGGPSHRLLCTRLNLACLATNWNICHVLDPATGAVHILPESPAVEHVSRVNWPYPYTFALGWVASTGGHKVLRTFNRPSYAKGRQQLFEVFTISRGTDHAQWRGQPNPGLFVECSGVVVDEVVYFLTSSLYDGVRNGIRPDYIISFDLGREEWRGDLRGPISSNLRSLEASCYKRHHLTLAELKGSLVVADHRRQPFIMDLWFLVEFGNGLWVKEYHMQTDPVISRPKDEYRLKPLLVLDDGRLVVYVAPIGQLFTCDPGTNTYEEADMRHLDSVGVYTGNLLSLEDGERV